MHYKYINTLTSRYHDGILISNMRATQVDKREMDVFNKGKFILRLHDRQLHSSSQNIFLYNSCCTVCICSPSSIPTYTQGVDIIMETLRN
jgi:hypothetical protein